MWDMLSPPIFPTIWGETLGPEDQENRASCMRSQHGPDSREACDLTFDLCRGGAAKPA